MIVSRRALRRFVGPELTLVNGAWLCVIAGVLLSLVGLYAIDLGARDLAPGGVAADGTAGIVLRQGVLLLLGLVAGALIAVPHPHYVRLIAWPLMAIVLFLLVFLLLPFVPASIVTPRNGARAWIDLGPIDFQPSELAKIAFVLVLADYLRFRENHRRWWGLIPPALIAFVPAALITLQPDLGTAMLFAPAIFAMLLVSGAKIKHLTLVVIVALLAAPAMYPMLKPHQKARIVGLIKMIQDPRLGADDINYQSLTAQTLAGAGGSVGVSDARSRALVKFNRLPERHNDMIYAVVVNRFGFFGGVLVLFLYAVWFAGAYLTAATTRDAFGRLAVVGVAAIFGAQVFINVGMTLGMLPIIGITLPFVSYGGASMIIVWMMTGLVFAVGMRPAARMARATFEFDAVPYDPTRAATAHRIEPMAGRR